VSDPKIGVALIGYHNFGLPFIDQRDHLYAHPWVIEEYRSTQADVTLNRDIIASQFLASTQADVLLSIDPDITYSRAAAIQICEQAMTYDIVAGMYVTRGKDERCRPTSILFPGQEIRFGNDPTPVEIMWAAGGFTAVHRRVFEKLAKNLEHCQEDQKGYARYAFYGQFVRKVPGAGWISLTEDYAFSQRARDYGFKVYLNPAVRLGHLGMEEHRLEHLFTREPAMVETTIRRDSVGVYHYEWVDAAAPDAKVAAVI
jgi:hypothetical protein